MLPNYKAKTNDDSLIIIRDRVDRNVVLFVELAEIVASDWSDFVANTHKRGIDESAGFAIVRQQSVSDCQLIRRRRLPTDDKIIPLIELDCEGR